jgi:ABC-2 type transport system ATP-binding protein
MPSLENRIMSEAVVEVRGVTRLYGRKAALSDVSFEIPRGRVFGLVGENGAGKTTLIRHLLGLLRAQSGSVRVFGLDPVADPVHVLGRIGYLSEDRDLPDWMRIGDLMHYLQPFYPKWDQSLADELIQTFELDRNQVIRGLSRGQRARVGLLGALAHRPELLILDEPSSGLDPVVRRDILGAIIRTVAEEGRTVLFSSHLLDEVERVADHVLMMHRGRVVMSDALDTIREDHRRITFRFPHPHAEAPTFPGVLATSGAGREWTFLCNGGAAELRAAATAVGGELAEEAAPSLDEIFVAHVTRHAPTAPV